MKKLIGFFDLDPHRVTDLALDMLEACPSGANVSAHVALLKSFESSSLPHLLGFKLNPTNATPPPTPSPSLFKVIALLIVHEMVTIGEILVYLNDNVDDIRDHYFAKCKEFANEIRTMGVVSLNAATTTKPKAAAIREEEEGEEGEEGEEDSGRASPSPDAATAAPTTPPRLVLIAALVSVNGWDYAKEMIDELKAEGVDSIFLCPKIGENLCELLRTTVNPLYLSTNPPRLSSNSPPSPASSVPLPPSSLPSLHNFDDMFSVLASPLKMLGSKALSSDPMLFTQLCRIFAKYLQDSGNDWSELQVCEGFWSAGRHAGRSAGRSETGERRNGRCECGVERSESGSRNRLRDWRAASQPFCSHPPPPLVRAAFVALCSHHVSRPSSRALYCPPSRCSRATRRRRWSSGRC